MRAPRGRDEPASRRPRRIVYAPVTFSEQDGVRYLHFGTEWIQGAMRLADPGAIELEYAQQMMIWTLFLERPRAIAQLGLGAAALTKFCHRHFPKADVVAVELNPAVVVAARTMFALPPDDRTLWVVESDAAVYVDDPASHDRFDALQVDLYDARAEGPVLESEAFYAGCRRCLTTPGVLTVNLFGQHASFARNMRSLRAAFDGRVIALPEVHEGNRIAIAFNGPPPACPVGPGRCARRGDRGGAGTAGHGMGRGAAEGPRERSCGIPHLTGIGCARGWDGALL